jgi:hypothetical protein
MAVERIAAGFKFLRYGVINSDGIFIGSTTTVPPVGTSTNGGMARLQGGRTLPLNISESTVLVVTGDDEPLVSFEFDPEDLPNGSFEMAVRNNAFEALIQGTLVNVLTSDAEVSIIDPKDRDSVTMCLLGSRRAKSWQSGSRGAKKWENLYVPSCVIKPLGVSVEQRAFSPYVYFFNLSKSDRTGWSTINTTQHGTTAASAVYIDSDNPLHLHRATGDGATTQFSVDFPPVSGAKSYVFVADLQQAVTTNYTLSGTSFTFLVAPANNAVIDFLYEVAEADIS